MTRLSQPEAGRAFLAMHRTKPGFALPNAWDAGSAILLASAGFPAIATTSAGIAFSLGQPDYQMGDTDLSVSREKMFERIREIAAAVSLPVNGDLEAGYGDTPEAVAETIRLAIDAGLAGGNIEDRVPGEARLYDESLAVERLRAAREAIGDVPFVLNARIDAFQMSGNALSEAIRRGNLYRAAGADCVFTPGPADIETVATLAREIDAPLNVVTGLGNAQQEVAPLLAAGVQRISLGGSIARAAMGFVRNAAQELRESGTIGFAAIQMQGGELNSLFRKARRT